MNETNSVKPLDGVFKLDTSDALTGDVKTEIEQIETFELVGEDDPILREVLPKFDFDNAVINPNDFASSLVETCKKYKGLGLSANQCGFPYRVFVMGAGDEFVAHFNPEVISTDGEAHMIEGCLSFPMLGLRITRAKKIEVKYQDFTGEYHTKTYEGLSARCFLHELDHMNGIVYTNRVKPLALQSGMKKRQKAYNQMVKYQTALMNHAKAQAKAQAKLKYGKNPG
jgi:peptide deformylase